MFAARFTREDVQTTGNADLDAALDALVDQHFNDLYTQLEPFPHQDAASLEYAVAYYGVDILKSLIQDGVIRLDTIAPGWEANALRLVFSVIKAFNSIAG